MRRARYPIRAVSKLTGIPAETLRAWERRYAAVTPERDDRGRVYSDQDVERLRLLRGAVEAGHPIGRVAPLSAEDLRDLLGDAPIAQAPRIGVDLAAVRDAIGRFDAPALRRELSRLAAILPAAAVCREVVLPLLREVGDAWHAGRLDIAAEHMVSAEIRSLLGALSRLHDARSGTGALVFATPEGEQHDLPTLAAAIVAADAGLGALFLGASLPPGEIRNAAIRAEAPVVVLGLTGARAGGNLDPLVAIRETSRSLPSGTELWIGGAGAEQGARAAGGRARAFQTFAGYERALARLRRR